MGGAKTNSGTGCSIVWNSCMKRRRRSSQTTPWTSCGTLSSRGNRSFAPRLAAYRPVHRAVNCTRRRPRSPVISLILSPSLLPFQPADDPVTEKQELEHLVKAVPRPENVAIFDALTPRVICQQFRYNTPVRSPQKKLPSQLTEIDQLHNDQNHSILSSGDDTDDHIVLRPGRKPEFQGYHARSEPDLRVHVQRVHVQSHLHPDQAGLGFKYGCSNATLGKSRRDAAPMLHATRQR